MDKLIGTLAVIYVGLIGISTVAGTIAIDKTCKKVECNGTEVLKENYQKFYQRLESQYKYL